MRYRLTKSSMKLPKFNNTEYTATVADDINCVTQKIGTIFGNELIFNPFHSSLLPI